MTIDEAIRIKLYDHEENVWEEGSPLEIADLMSIEALKAYQKAQEAGWYPPRYKLPGETKE